MCPSVWLSDWLSIFQGFKSACYPLSIELSLKYQEKMRSAPTFGCVGGSIRGLCPPIPLRIEPLLRLKNWAFQSLSARAVCLKVSKLLR